MPVFFYNIDILFFVMIRLIPALIIMRLHMGHGSVSSISSDVSYSLPIKYMSAPIISCLDADMIAFCSACTLSQSE